MAVTHIVWIKFRDGVAQASIDKHVAALTSLEHSVPGIVQLTIGENFTERAEGYTHGLVVILDDKAALTTYATHPRHVEVATALREDADILALDYEC
jgi:hypothetical protein